jgi:hypothetical protein
MTHTWSRLTPCGLIALWGLITLAPCSVSAAVIAQYNLGEDDPGAFAGFVGNDPTNDALGGNALKRTGGPIYSSNVPAGGSTLSMDFGTPDNYYNGPAPTTDFATNNITIEFDAYMVTPGTSGFSFLVSMGSNFGGFSVVEIGGAVSAFMPGAGGGASVPVTLNQWQHYKLHWDAPSTTLSLELDGSLVSTRVGNPANNQIVNSLTLGANDRRSDPANDPLFEGFFIGLLDNVVVSAVPIPEPGAILLAGLACTFAVANRRRS